MDISGRKMSNLSFEGVQVAQREQYYPLRKARIDEANRRYQDMHEADITKFVQIADARIREHFPETALKRLRTICGCSQTELASRSGVSLRSIQMYEQRHKDINKACAQTLYSLAKVLGCSMEDLLEK